MAFPRLAIHTGATVVITNKHPEWEGTIVLQHNDTTATMLRFGPRLSNAARNRHPLLSTWQSDCAGRHWADFHTASPNGNDADFLGQVVNAGQVIPDVPATVPPAVTEAVAH